MKIIQIDNFDRDYISDVLVCENVNEYYGKKILDFLIKSLSNDTGQNYYRLVEDDYKLYTFEN
jgi:hypothetical protein